MGYYFRGAAFTLRHSVGQNEADGTRVTDGRAGALSFGPYVSLARGSFRGGFYVELLEASPDDRYIVDVVHSDAAVTLARRDVFASHLAVGITTLSCASFNVVADVVGVEVRLLVTEGLKLRVHSLVLFESS